MEESTAPGDVQAIEIRKNIREAFRRRDPEALAALLTPLGQGQPAYTLVADLFREAIEHYQKQRAYPFEQQDAPVMEAFLEKLPALANIIYYNSDFKKRMQANTPLEVVMHGSAGITQRDWVKFFLDHGARLDLVMQDTALLGPPSRDCNLDTLNLLWEREFRPALSPKAVKEYRSTPLHN